MTRAEAIAVLRKELALYERHADELEVDAERFVDEDPEYADSCEIGALDNLEVAKALRYAIRELEAVEQGNSSNE